MEIRLELIGLDQVRDEISGHLLAQSSPIDSFLEDHILASNHYRIMIGGQVGGVAAVHEQSLMTQFIVRDGFRQFGQQAFREVRRTEHVKSVFVATSDEYYLSHALDDVREIKPQAYFFAAGSPELVPGPDVQFALQQAATSDVSVVRAETGDFFDPIDRRVDAGNLFLTLLRGEVAGFGLIEPSSLQPGIASVGMFTVSRFRGSGIGTNTIRLLIEECRQRGLRPVAGCWYYNHASKRTLERAGLYSPTRLLRIEY